jgi:hypothetical protein
MEVEGGIIVSLRTVVLLLDWKCKPIFISVCLLEVEEVGDVIAYFQVLHTYVYVCMYTYVYSHMYVYAYLK